jgi:WD40 repeat protein
VIYTQILSVAISPAKNLNHIASVGDDGKLVVADTVTGDLKFSCDAHENWIPCVTYSPDGKTIATCSNDGTISVWNAADGSRLLGPFGYDNKAVLFIAFSPDGKELISGNAHSWATFSGILRSCFREHRYYCPFLDPQLPHFRSAYSTLNLSRPYWPCASSGIRR